MLPRGQRVTHNFKKVVHCCVLLLSLVINGNMFAHELPDLGNSSSTALNAAQEQELGLGVIKELEAAMALNKDPIINEYLQSLGYRLIATHGGSHVPYQFFAVKDNSINAFALPGGFIGVNTGLVLASESESELAGVLAHEVGHVQQHHIARMFEHMGRLRLSTIAGLLASVIIATQNPQAGSGAMAATLAGNQQVLINYTREHEKEADFVGIQTLAKAGFDPMGMPAFFHRMYQDTRFYGNHIPEYLLTHPLTETRLMAAQTRAKSFPYKQIPDSLEFHLIHARLLAQSFSTAHEASHHFGQKLKRGNYRNEVGTLYGYALALIEEGKLAEAKLPLNRLLQNYPDHPFFHMAYAQIEIANHPNKALDRLANALENHPNNFPLLIAYIESLIKTGKGLQAIPLLKLQLSKKPLRVEYWSLLSRAYSQTKQPLQAHVAQAHYLKARGDLAGAITQLKLAKKLALTSSIEQRQIDAQMEELNRKSPK